IVFLNLPISFIGLKYFEAKSEFVFYVSIFLSVFAFIFRLYFLKNMINFPIARYLKTVILRVLLLFIPCLLACQIVYRYLKELHEVHFLIVSTTVLLIVTLTFIFIIGLDKNEKTFVQRMVIGKIKK